MGEHPKLHLKGFTGVLQADPCSGFNDLYQGPRILEAGRWAHVRQERSGSNASCGSGRRGPGDETSISQRVNTTSL